jgi:hypothetical protein
MIPAPIKPPITLDHLAAVDIRVGTIRSVDNVPGADKLVALRVSFGDHERTIVVGLKMERADPHEILDKQALFVVNLPSLLVRNFNDFPIFPYLRYAKIGKSFLRCRAALFSSVGRTDERRGLRSDRSLQSHRPDRLKPSACI